MALPWRTLESIPTDDGLLELRQRGQRDFLITIAGRVLMTSASHGSEDELARAACGGLGRAAAPRVLVGGLGMGYTLRAALSLLPAGALVWVAEINPAVVGWCRGPLAALTGGAVADPRVRVEVADVADVVAGLALRGERLDAMLVDLCEGPHGPRAGEAVAIYGRRALEQARGLLEPGGLLAVWTEHPDAAFEGRLVAAGFGVEGRRAGRGGHRHFVYVASAGQNGRTGRRR
jgi:spermidine synthase